MDRYRDLLNEEELKFSSSVLELSADAQRLYARILSRRGPIFLLAQFVYREVKHAASAFDELERNKLINRTAEVPTELLCQKLTLRQLREVFELQEFKGSKLALVSEIQDTYAEENILERIRQRLPWFELDQTDRIATFSLLFLGIVTRISARSLSMTLGSCALNNTLLTQRIDNSRVDTTLTVT
ncbi:MAG: hypothetical protein F4X56_07725 [Gammaproteobacteria bacterium]|nr:hypothetical protein [Gammaproteobacteria bacterium]